MKTVTREIVAMDNELILIGGDWNVALNPKIDTNHPSNVYRVRSRKQMALLMFIEPCTQTPASILGGTSMVHREVDWISVFFLSS